MRALLTLGLLASLVGLVCVDDSNGCCRRNRHRYCQPNVCADGYGGSSCSCNDGMLTYTATCESGQGCYAVKYKGKCYVGCAGNVTTISQIGNDKLEEFHVYRLTYNELDALLVLTGEHTGRIDPAWRSKWVRRGGPSSIYQPDVTQDGKTVKEIMSYVGIDHDP